MAKPLPEPAHTNFVKAFRSGAVFRTKDQGKLVEIVVRPKRVAVLRVPSGKIVACEPSKLDYEEDCPAFNRTVTPGAYPVYVSFAIFGKHYIPCCIIVQIKKARPVRWELATRVGDDLSKLKPGQRVGYSVDGGIGGFVDGKAAKAIARAAKKRKKQSSEFDSTIFDQVFKAVNGAGANNWFEFDVDEDRGANVVGCLSGYGDGWYASYWGFDREGEAIALVTDFNLFSEAVYETIILSPLHKLINNKIVNTQLQDYSIEMRLTRKGPNKVVMTYKSDFNIEAKVYDSAGAVIADSEASDVEEYDNRTHLSLPLTADEVKDAKMVLTFACGSKPV